MMSQNCDYTNSCTKVTSTSFKAYTNDIRIKPCSLLVVNFLLNLNLVVQSHSDYC